jgi:hypothetical protein
MTAKKSSSLMKAFFKAVAMCIAIATLASCSSKLSGTYVSQDILAQKFTFNGNKITMSAFGINASGTYTISDDTIIINYSLLGFSSDWQQSFEKKGSSIYIGGTEFKKQ